MILLDSNIIIYAADPRYPFIRELIRRHGPEVSLVSKIEVLGYHGLTPEQRTYFQAFFDATLVISLNDRIIAQAITLRQQRRMSLGDAIIAATALVCDDTLVTRNTADFAWIPELHLHNPFQPVGDEQAEHEIGESYVP